MSIDAVKFDSFAKANGIVFHYLKVVFEKTDEPNCIEFSSENKLDGFNKNTEFENQVFLVKINGVRQHVHGELAVDDHENASMMFKIYPASKLFEHMENNGVPLSKKGFETMRNCANLARKLGFETSEGSALFTSTWLYAAAGLYDSIKEAHQDLSIRFKNIENSFADKTEKPKVPHVAARSVRESNASIDPPEPEVVQKPVAVITIDTEPAAPKKRGRKPRQPEAPVEPQPTEEPSSKRQKIPSTEETPAQRFDKILGAGKSFYEQLKSQLHKYRSLWKPKEKFALQFLVDSDIVITNEIRTQLYVLSFELAHRIKKTNFEPSIKLPVLTTTELFYSPAGIAAQRSEATEYVRQLNQISTDFGYIESLFVEEKTTDEWCELLLKKAPYVVVFFQQIKEFSSNDQPTADKTLFPRAAAVAYAMVNGLRIEDPEELNMPEAYF